MAEDRRSVQSRRLADGRRQAPRHRRRRRDKMRERKHDEIAHTLDEAQDDTTDAALDDDLGDELLGLIFTPAIPSCRPTPARRSPCGSRGLTTDEIARAFLSTEATISQRITRAKKAIANAGLGFETPRGADGPKGCPRCSRSFYLIFNEGYAATAGDDLVRPGLCLEAQRLGRIPQR